MAMDTNRIVLLEDEEIYAKELQEQLLPLIAPLDIEWCSTEVVFMSNLATWADEPPLLFILDMMVRWADPGTAAPKQPEEVHSHFRSGIRCYRHLRKHSVFAKTPILFSTVVSTEQFQQDIPHSDLAVSVYHKARYSISDLAHTIRSYLPDVRFTKPSKHGVWKRIVDATELKPGAFGISFNLKKAIKPDSE
ncbi:MAG TPA: hypothetical protein VN784_01230 [Candidatus Limnocylindrales bacterium]|nr:hypothetical protein [Candidatus Limnocylindrales bacterium]